MLPSLVCNDYCSGRRPIYAIEDLIKGPVTETLSFNSIHYQENYNHLVHTQPYFYLWLLKTDSSAILLCSN